jgi:hypothetical protein
MMWNGFFDLQVIDQFVPSSSPSSPSMTSLTHCQPDGLLALTWLMMIGFQEAK